MTAIVINTMAHVGVAQVKARFSEFLARARAGEEVVVTDRGRPVARLVPVARDTAPASEAELTELEREGIVRVGGMRIPAGFSDLELPEDPNGAVREALLEERAAGR